MAGLRRQAAVLGFFLVVAFPLFYFVYKFANPEDAGLRDQPQEHGIRVGGVEVESVSLDVAGQRVFFECHRMRPDAPAEHKVVAEVFYRHIVVVVEDERRTMGLAQLKFLA